MSTNTLKDAFSSSITDFYVNHVSSHLCDWLKANKGVECTQQELCSAFGVPFTPRATMAGLPQAANMATQMPQLPGYYHGTGASPARRGGRKKAPPDPNAPRCVYQFQRGNRKGQVCGEQVAQNGEPGSNEYCKGCLKKKTVQNRIKSGSAGRSTVQPPVVPGGMVPVPQQAPAANDNTIKAVPIEGHSDMFKDLDHGFILKQYPDGSIVAMSVEENGAQRPLTADEKKTAQLRGLSVLDSPAQDQTQTVTQTVPTIPQVPQVPAAAPVPAQTVPQTVPTIPTVPQVPAAAPAPAQPVPQTVPTIPTVPQVPAAAPTQAQAAAPAQAVPTVPQVSQTTPTVTPVPQVATQ